MTRSDIEQLAEEITPYAAEAESGRGKFLEKTKEMLTEWQLATEELHLLREFERRVVIANDEMTPPGATCRILREAVEWLGEQRKAVNDDKTPRMQH